jgi:hypothetical protein
MIIAFKRTVSVIRLGLSVYLIIAASSNSAAAMDFSTKQLSDGDRFILAKGEIVDGDAERLRIALQSVGRNRYGNKEMALESGGPSEMIWFSSKDADCYGFTRWPPGVNRGKQPGEIAPCIERALKGN